MSAVQVYRQVLDAAWQRWRGSPAFGWLLGAAGLWTLGNGLVSLRHPQLALLIWLGGLTTIGWALFVASLLRFGLLIRPWTGAKPSAAQTVCRNPFKFVERWMYTRWLVRQSDQQSESLVSRAMLGLGLGGPHWVACLFPAFFVLVYFVGQWAAWLAAIYTNAHSSIHPETHFHQSLPAPAIFAVAAFMAIRWICALPGQKVLYKLQREQALLMLLPGMPHGAALNRALGWWLLLQFTAKSVAWAMINGFWIAVDPSLANGLLCIAASTLWPAAWLCTDWSAKVSTRGSAIAARVVCLGSMAVTLYAHLALDVPLMVCTVAQTIAALSFTAWCYQAMLRAPSAFPVGRLHNSA